jgi:uncharacterized membrane protein
VVVSLAVAGSFAAAGYWPVLPFAGLELLALGGALHWSMRQGRRRELIRVDDDTVTVSKFAGGSEREYKFSRPWTRIELLRPAAANWPCRLVLRSKGRSVEVGSFLTEAERDGLRRRLAELIDSRQGNARQMPRRLPLEWN